MGFLKNFFVEEVNEDEFLDEELYAEAETEEVEINTENVSQNNLIEDIYSQNELADLSKSIFKVEELINSLPKEMPKETKKVTVLSILSSFGLTVGEVLDDGLERASIVRAALEAIVEENKNAIADNNAIIEQKKREIQELEKNNANRENVIDSTEDKVEVELKRIADLVDFVGGEK